MHLHHYIYIYIYVPLKEQTRVIINRQINNEGHINSLNKVARICAIDLDFTSSVVKSL